MMLQPTFQRFSAEHIDDALEIEKLSFRTPWSRLAFLHEIGFQNSIFEVMHVDGQLAGYGGFWHIMDEAHISNIAIHPDFRRRGLARKLLVHLLEEAVAAGVVMATLEVRRSNEAALALYGSFGFEIAAVRKNYYSDEGEDALIMWSEDIKAGLEAVKRDEAPES